MILTREEAEHLLHQCPEGHWITTNACDICWVARHRCSSFAVTQEARDSLNVAREALDVAQRKLARL